MRRDLEVLMFARGLVARVRARYPGFLAHFALASLVFALASAASVSTPYLLRQAINGLSEASGPAAAVLAAVLAYGVCWTFAAMLQNLKGICSAYVLAHSDAALAAACYESVLHERHVVQREIKPGELAQDIHRATLAFSAVLFAVCWTLLPLIFELLFTVVLLQLSVGAAVSVLFAIGFMLLSLVSVFVAGRTQGLHRAMFEADNRVQAFVIERLSALLEIKAARAEQKDVQQLEALLGRQARTVWQGNRTMGLYLGAQALAIGLFLILCTLVVFRLKTRGQLSIGDIAMVAGYVGGISSQLHLFAGAVIEVKRNHLALQRISSLLAVLAPAGRRAEGALLGHTEGDPLFELDQVRCRAHEEGVLLPRVTARIARRAMTVITGPSGVGKTTLLLSMLGFLPLAEGRIRYAGVDLESLPEGQVLEQVAFVPQEPVVFSGTLRDYLFYGAGSDASEAEACAMLRELDLSDALGEGREASLLDALLGAGGRQLSGGEVKRLAIARAVLSGKPVLMLDEPSAGLDAARAEIVLECLRSRGLTLIVVSHDDVIIRAADAVIRVMPLDQDTEREASLSW